MVYSVNPKFKVGQQVMITKPVDPSATSMRDCTLEPYLGCTGRVKKYYSIGPRPGEIFFVYVVAIDVHGRVKEIILHEDEIEMTFASA